MVGEEREDRVSAAGIESKGRAERTVMASISASDNSGLRNRWGRCRKSSMTCTLGLAALTGGEGAVMAANNGAAAGTVG